MAENRQLTNAKSAKNYEFYSQYADIQKEVNAYLFSVSFVLKISLQNFADFARDTIQTPPAVMQEETKKWGISLSRATFDFPANM